MQESCPSPAWRPPARAAYAADPWQSRGRLIDEPSSPTRTEFQRDRDRILHSTAFRRLAHKTQVFVPHEGDHFRTRLTHSLEVGQIARSTARALGLDDDLAEALALAHDLGHTPFGHTGEEALDELMAPYGGFDHNAQALRLVTKLEKRYAGFDGLNLTWETLEGLVKHNGPLLGADGQPGPRYGKRGLPGAILEYNACQNLALADFASAEAQAAALADDIAYNAHDLDDGLRSGLIDLTELDEIAELAVMKAEIAALYPGLEPARTIHEVTRRLITSLIEDAIGESRRRLTQTAVTSVAEVRSQKAPLVGFSPDMVSTCASVATFLFERIYRHPRLLEIRDRARLIVQDLFVSFMQSYERLPPDWARAAAAADPQRRARLICDYIAGMTDLYAIAEHQRLFAKTPELRLRKDDFSRLGGCVSR